MGMAANPSGAHQAGELSLANADEFRRLGFGRALPERGHAHSQFYCFDGPWPRQGKALPIEFRREINGYIGRIAVDFTIRHTGGTRCGAMNRSPPKLDRSEIEMSR